ncbi:unnamed protein product [Brassicogethes aeneus]|uniref:Uncharacterized protein n=1 Tax=Brassicogethes aeneus TaxID=1431903 RepID=A0A9P0B4D3_BRAAE|nr:unnamed protein product [Brassicogethes aeneus]
MEILKNENESFHKRRLLFSHIYWSANQIDNSFAAKFSSNDWAPVVIVPLLATILLAISVFLLIIFRQNPAFVISTVAGCLIFVTIYLTLTAIDSSRQTFS